MSHTLDLNMSVTGAIPQRMFDPMLSHLTLCYLVLPPHLFILRKILIASYESFSMHLKIFHEMNCFTGKS